MKSLTVFFLIYIVLFLTSYGQAEKSKIILDKVSAKTKSYSTITVDFKITIENKKDNTTDYQSGKFKLKNNMFKYSIQGQTVFCNGATLWTYINELNEVHITNYDKSDENIYTPTTILTIWEKDFKHKFIKEVTENNITYQVIDLVPIELDPKKTKPYHRIRLYINKEKEQLAKAIIYEKKGKEITFELSNFNANETINDSEFTFDESKYPDIYIEDLR